MGQRGNEVSGKAALIAIGLTILIDSPVAWGQSAALPGSAPPKATAPPTAAAPGPAASAPQAAPATLGLGGAPSALPSGSSSTDAGAESCRDTWPEDRARPKFIERFPLRGTSGHVAMLELDVEHLPGESVFPAGLEFREDDMLHDLLNNASFRLPALASDVKPTLKRGTENNKTVTEVRLPVIVLPAEAGRKELTLPRLPVAIARASGQVHTICTQPHVITVEDPLASVPDPQAKPDPEPRPQIEVWTTLRDIVLTLLWALPLAFLIAWLLFRYRDKLKKRTPPPPPIPPWETARRQLSELEHRGLLEKEEFELYLDTVCDILREYVGERYGFEGLESTTRELLRQLEQRAPHFPEGDGVKTVLQRADLVKFARRIPSEEECRDALLLMRRILDKTVPAPSLDPRPRAESLRAEAPRSENKGGEQ